MDFLFGGINSVGLQLFLVRQSICTKLIFQELELYKSELLSKPAVLVLNKIDVEDPDINVDDVVKLARELSGKLRPILQKFCDRCKGC